MTDNKILITKTRSGGNRMVRADTKDGLGNGTWINANQLDNTLIDPGIISAKVRKPRGGLFRLTLAGGVKTWAYGDEIIVRNEVSA